MPETSNQTPRRATAAEILGRPFAPKKVPARWKTAYANLLQLHSQLTWRRASLVEAAHEEQPSFSEHMGDAGTDQYDSDFALSMLSSDQNAIYDIEEAMERIHAGTYGICEMTGEQIDPERLAAIPWTRYSAQAQHKLEQEGQFRRTRFSQAQGLMAATAPPDEDSGETESA